MVTVTAESLDARDGFRHEAFFYADEDAFAAGTTAFLEEGIRAGEPALVVLNAGKIDLLRRQLGDGSGTVLYADMDEVGRNPARIIPAWRAFVDSHGPRALRGIGEPIWAERTPAELVECQRHEALLNVAFAGSHGFTLLCPYDTTALDDETVAEARRSHPFVGGHGIDTANSDYAGTEALAAPFAAPLPAAPPEAQTVSFGAGTLDGVRSLVREAAMAAGLGATGVDDAVVAVNEVVSNSLRYGGGGGVLRLWSADTTLVCEVSDGGHIGEPLVGRRRPTSGASGGRGLWMANQLCALVQVRSFPTGTTVRLHLRPGDV